MSQLEILDEIKKLPPDERYSIAEAVLQMDKQNAGKVKLESKLSRSERRKRAEKAAEALVEDYLNDSEVTAFTVLDGEDFLD